MAGLIQTSSSIVNSSLVSLALWFRIPTGATGQFDIFAVTNNSGLYGFEVYADISTKQLGWSGGDVTSGQGMATYFSTWLSQNNSFVFDAWHFGFFAINTNHVGGDYLTDDLGTPISDPKIGICQINGVQKNGSGHNGVTTSPQIDRDLVNGVGSAYSCGFNGLAIGLPTTPDANGGMLSVSRRMEFADVQMWRGQYIDITNPTNFSKFITITGGLGYPVDPSVATAAFGTQTILFKGKASDSSFYFNRGNGGSFSKVGTISDFTPTPSYA